MVQPTRADPASGSLKGMQGRQEEVAPCDRSTPATKDKPFADHNRRRAHTGDHSVNRRRLLRGW
jgi:hypothetical protein